MKTDLLVLAVCLLATCCGEKGKVDLWGNPETVTPGGGGEINLAEGKFYLFTGTADSTYPDLYPCSPWSSGTKLTDGETGDIRQKKLGVAWSGQDVEIVVDLGKKRKISKAGVHAISDQIWKTAYPSAVTVDVSLDRHSWIEAGTLDWQDKATSIHSWAEAAFSAVDARYVRFSVAAPASPSTTMLLDEITVIGKYENDWKYVPAEGAYHGAFNNSQTFSDEGIKTNFVSEFESRVGKNLSLMLWYQGMKPGRNFAEMQDARAKYVAEGRDSGYRFFMYGWIPDTYTAAQLADGSMDEYWKEYFSDVREVQKADKDYGPVWFRPANEMNGSWLSYSGDPVNYVRFWRRLYNIAEQMGLTDYNVFVWAVSDKTYNSSSHVKPDAKMKDYYPGDQYVDWIGASVYYHTGMGLYPSSLMNELEGITADKPVMVAEGAFRPTIEGCDNIRWVREWFGLQETHPRVKAVVWFNMWGEVSDGRIHKIPEALSVYREKVRDDYWLDDIPRSVLDEVAMRKARQNKDN